MMIQYLSAKKENPDALLFFRMGDFYEMFFEDAETASRALEIVLTARESGGEKVPMCGVPHHSASGYIARLINQGFKVAICEQVEDPRQATGIVRREVVRVITPGTILEDYMLDEGRNNYVAALYQLENCAGVAYLDVSTGDFMCSWLKGPELLEDCKSELLRIEPAECLLCADEDFGEALCGHEHLEGLSFQACAYSPGNELREGEGFPMESRVAAAMLLDFVNNAYRADLRQIKSLRMYQPERHLALDAAARRNLELTSSLKDNRRRGTLLEVLNHCRTAMGQRLLRRWLEEPLLDAGEINRRLDAVEEILLDLALQEALRQALKGIYDIERLCGRLGGGMASPRDMLALRQSLDGLSAIKDVLKNRRSNLLAELGGMNPCSDLCALLHSGLADNPPAQLKDGGVIRDGYDSLVDQLRGLESAGKDWLVEYELRQKELTGIKHLKVGFNRVFGYYIEVSKGSASQVPDEYLRRQTLANNERFITPELKEYEERIFNSRERLQETEERLYGELLQKALEQLANLQASAVKLAQLDVLCSLARAAYENDYVRPGFVRGDMLEIRGGRHPVVEKLLKEGSFVPNDLQMDRERHNFGLITGPNMGGKSTFMRQAALIVLMAQMGSFVPARQARMGIIDRICTRVGASDDLAGGQSTFMVEMQEVAAILSSATPHSLVILDEVGRGTSTYDGISIAQALSEYICREIGAFALFATHYHELTSLEGSVPGLFNLSVSVLEQGSQITFLKRVLPGKADRSYGIHVARMAALPEGLVNRAEILLEQMESASRQLPGPALEQPGLFDSLPAAHPVLKELEALDPDSLSPREALMAIFRWKDSLK